MKPVETHTQGIEGRPVTFKEQDGKLIGSVTFACGADLAALGRDRAASMIRRALFFEIQSWLAE